MMFAMALASQAQQEVRVLEVNNNGTFYRVNGSQITEEHMSNGGTRFTIKDFEWGPRINYATTFAPGLNGTTPANPEDVAACKSPVPGRDAVCGPSEWLDSQGTRYLDCKETNNSVCVLRSAGAK